MTLDIPNAFVQTPMPASNEKVVKRITGQLAHLLLETVPKNMRLREHRKQHNCHLRRNTEGPR